MSYLSTGATSQPVIQCVRAPCPTTMPIPISTAPALVTTPTVEPKKTSGLVLLAAAGLGVFFLMR